MNRQFRPNRTVALEKRLEHIERFLVEAMGSVETAAPETAASGGGSGIELPLPEHDVEFDGDEGHAHDGDEGGTRVDHDNLTNVTANQHHNQSHVLATNAGLGADHTMSGATSGHVLRASGATAAAFAQLQHSDLGGVTSDQHHAQSHVLATNSGLGADHTISGATAGHALRASGATAAAFAQMQHTDLGGVSADQHHAQAHVLATNSGLGADHTISGATAGHALRASSATAAAFAQMQHSDLGGVSANQHHNQSHELASGSGLGADHTVSGATAGDALRASSATAAAFSSGDLNNNARVNVKKAGSSVGIRRGINFIEGTNITLTVTDDSGSEEVDITVAASGAATQYVFLGEWWTNDISAIGTTMVEIPNAAAQGSGGVPQNHPELTGLAGTLSLIVATCDGAVGGTSLTLEVYKDGVATGDTLVLDAADQAKAGTISESVTAANLITVWAKETGSCNARRLVVRLYLTPS